MPDKPAGMSWESFADAQVRQAIRAGEFDRLPGAGKPIAGLDEPYRDNWWLRNYLQREELSLPCPALDLRVEVEKTVAQILLLPSESAVRRAIEALNVRIAAANRTVSSGPATSMSKLDAEAMLACWRSRGSTLPYSVKRPE